MSFISKVLIGLGLFSLFLWNVVIGQASTPSPGECPCLYNNETAALLTGGDLCNASGTFKSQSICFTDSATDLIYGPYDYFRCVPYGSTFLIYRYRCTNVPWTIIFTDNEALMNDGFDYQYYNGYDPQTGKCVPPGQGEAVENSCADPPQLN